MKIEIEIAESEIKSSLEKKAHALIAQELGGWAFEKFVKQTIQENLKASVQPLILHELQQSEILREKIRAEIERKLKRQVLQLIKEKAK